jgi:hypothetical protein
MSLDHLHIDDTAREILRQEFSHESGAYTNVDVRSFLHVLDKAERNAHGGTITSAHVRAALETSASRLMMPTKSAFQAHFGR